MNYVLTKSAREVMSCQVAIDDRELLTEQNGRFLRGHFVGSAQGSAQEIRGKIHGNPWDVLNQVMLS